MQTTNASPVGSTPGPTTPGGELEQIAPFAWPATSPLSKPPAPPAPAAANAPERVGLGDSVPCLAEGLRDNWERVKDSLKRQFGELRDEDLMYVERLEEAVIDHIREKTGRSRENITAALHAAIVAAPEEDPTNEAH